MRIAFICTEKLTVPPISGGAIQLYIEGILPYLSTHHNITVFCIQNTALPNMETIDNINYIRVEASSPDVYIKNIINELKSLDAFDLIHVFNRPKWVLDFKEACPNAKFSLSLHNDMFEPHKITQEKAISCINIVEFINTVSKYVANRVIELYPISANKLNTVYSGANPDIYATNWSEEGKSNSKNLKEKYNISNKKVVIFVGRLGVKKGVHVLLKAMRNVMDQHPDVALVVVGSKWYGENNSNNYTKLLDVMSSRLTGPIVFTGFLPPHEIPSIYNIADIFVCPSQWNEPLARVHYEAMAAGIPIITTNRGGNSEVVLEYNNGFVIDDYDNASSFSKQIQFLLQNPDIANEMGQNGRKLVEEKFNWCRVANELLDLITNI